MKKLRFKEMNTDISVTPGGMTHELQVIYVVTNKPFKDNQQRLYNVWLVAGNHPLIAIQKIQKPSITELSNWIMSV